MRIHWKSVFVLLCVLFLGLIPVLIFIEIKTDFFQSLFFHNLSGNLTYSLEEGPSGNIHFPEEGPFNQRRGYTELPQISQRLLEKNFAVDSQAVLSALHKSWMEKGLHPIYQTSPAAGIELSARGEKPLYKKEFPGYYYKRFEDIPPVIVQSLLYIENKSLLDSTHERMNPTIAWKRQLNAAWELVKKLMGKDINVSGGSTLATQIEKFKFSPDGQTRDAKDKLVQILSGSARAYREGPHTLSARKKIVTDYINSVPLSARTGYGEINGIAEGFDAWYDTPIDSVNKYLQAHRIANVQGLGPGELSRMGNYYRMVLNLFVSQRRPTYYLREKPEVLAGLVNNYLALLEEDGFLPRELRKAARDANPPLSHRTKFDSPFTLKNKAAYSLRTKISHVLGVESLYNLDRLDFTAVTTIDKSVQDHVVDYLGRLSDPAFVKTSHYNSFRMLDRGNPSDVVYSLIVYQKGKGKNLLRVYADNFPQPLNINEGGKLDLGSTAKLRTLVMYLEIANETYQKFEWLSGNQLDSIIQKRSDALSIWVASYVKSNKPPEAFLNAALERKYSASPHERFYTGGGTHFFHNFDNKDDGKIFTVREAFQRSNNLVFIRLMRDVLRHKIYSNPNLSVLLGDSLTQSRRDYLERFAAYEGKVFLGRFYKKYRGLDSDSLSKLLVQSFRPTPKRLVYFHYNLFPESGFPGFHQFLESENLLLNLSRDQWEKIYQLNNNPYILTDLAYLLRIHPLEIWTGQMLLKYPGITWNALSDSSAATIQIIYEWLMNPKRKKIQNNRIWTMLETEAFVQFHQRWKKLGYPFGFLTPSLATAIGSSADRPAALAELMGILIHGGMRVPNYTFSGLQFAKGTPYETHFLQGPTQSERVLDSNVARAALSCLNEVVTKGTAVRLKNAYKDSSGTPLEAGGKTGTGDHVYKVYGPSGILKSKRVVGRTATFVFHINNELFGVLSASVQGEKAAQYGFTSGLPVQILKDLEPAVSEVFRKKVY